MLTVSRVLGGDLGYLTPVLPEVPDCGTVLSRPDGRSADGQPRRSNAAGDPQFRSMGQHRNATETTPSFNRKPKACAFGLEERKTPGNACGPTCGRCPALG